MDHIDTIYIDGTFVTPHGTELFDLHNPATGAVIGTVRLGDETDTRAAIAAAKRAFPAFSRSTKEERIGLLGRLADAVEARSSDLVEATIEEYGAPVSRSAWTADYAVAVFRLAAQTLADYDFTRRIGTATVTMEPLGVVGVITPWNANAGFICGKLAMVIASGSTCVIKPSEMSAMQTRIVLEALHEAGVPKGVFSVVTGSASAIGGEMTSNPIVRKVTFTGSTEIGKKLMEQSASTVKRTSMELGGNAPFIVFDDADIDAAVKGAMASKYRNAGQTCVCVNRIFAQDKIYDAFVEKLSQAVRGLKVGDGFGEGVTIGPLINMAAVEKVEEHIADATRKGAKIAVGGKRHALGRTFYEPTVLTGTTPDMLIFREETFGPVAPVFRFKTEDEAIRLANDTEFGLAAYFYGRDIGRVWRVAEALEYGMVGINEGIISTEVAPFGGVKESGNGREGSKYGIEDYLEIKYLCMGGI